GPSTIDDVVVPSTNHVHPAAPDARILSGDFVCRLFAGCDGGSECPAHPACMRCFEQAHDDQGCTELFLLQACESRGAGRSQRAYERVVRECERVYRAPSQWPSP